MEEIAHQEVALRIVLMPDTDDSPEGQLLTNVKGIIAEYERAKILERTARGRRGRAQAGYPPGGAVALGYTRVLQAGKSTHYAIDPEEAAIVQRIFHLYLDGKSQEGIAALLTREGVPVPAGRRNGPKRTLAAPRWHQAGISHILSNTAYLGTLYFGKRTRLSGKHNPDKKTRWQAVPEDERILIAVPPLITPEVFAAAQAKRVRNKTQSPRNCKHAYVFTAGRLRCGQCGSAMTGYLDSSGVARYRCGRKAYMDLVTPHTKRSVQAKMIESRVWTALLKALQEPALIAAVVADRHTGAATREAAIATERRHYQTQLAQCDRELTRWEAAYLGEAIDLADFKAKKAEVAARRVSAEQELIRLREEEQLLAQHRHSTLALKAYCAGACA